MATSSHVGLSSPISSQSTRSQCVVISKRFSPVLTSARVSTHLNHVPPLQFTRNSVALVARRPQLHVQWTKHQSLPEATKRTLLIPHSLPAASYDISNDNDGNTTNPNALSLSTSSSDFEENFNKPTGEQPQNNPSPSADEIDDASSSNTEIKLDLNLPRRSRLITFTCNLCNGRSERLVNPLAWEKGLVIVQCQHCEKWHKVADAANLVEEIRYADLEEEESGN